MGSRRDAKTQNIPPGISYSKSTLTLRLRVLARKKEFNLSI
jgi:hypothetical protein